MNTWNTASLTAWNTTYVPSIEFMNRISNNLSFLKQTWDSGVDDAPGFNITTWTADHTWYGDASDEMVAEDGSLFDALYHDSTGLKKAKGDAAGTMPCNCIRLETGTSARLTMQEGYIKDNSWSWTVGDLLWVSADTAGLITATKPADVGDRVQCIGYAVATNIIYVNIGQAWNVVEE